MTRLDRNEPGLNAATPGDERDTTSPRAMAEDLRQVLLGDLLSEASRRQLEAWLVDDKVGDKRLRAGLPLTWRIGDKTGSGDHGTANTIAIIWPPERAPIIAAVYYTEFIRAGRCAQRHSQGDRRADRGDVLRADHCGAAFTAAPRHIPDCRPSPPRPSLSGGPRAGKRVA